MKIDFAGSTAFVTGSSSGIGAAAVERLIAVGANVVGFDLTPSPRARSDQFLAIVGDVVDEASVAGAIENAVAEFGRLDLALNNAAIIPPLALLADVELSDWERTLRVNLTGPMLCLKHEIRQMVTSGGGAIVNLASAASLTAYPGRPGYVASKHGLAGLTKAAAVEYGRAGIRVNALCPGLVMTPMADNLTGGDPAATEMLVGMFPLGRAAEAGEIADIAILLLSPLTAYMTGAIVSADAGFTAQ